MATWQFLWPRRIVRMGELMSAGDSEAVATWYSSGWNTWWLRRSITVTSTGAAANALAAARPAEPPPTMNNFEGGFEVIARPSSESGAHLSMYGTPSDRLLHRLLDFDEDNLSRGGQRFVRHRDSSEGFRPNRCETSPDLRHGPLPCGRFPEDPGPARNLGRISGGVNRTQCSRYANASFPPQVQEPAQIVIGDAPTTNPGC